MSRNQTSIAAKLCLYTLCYCHKAGMSRRSLKDSCRHKNSNEVSDNTMQEVMFEVGARHLDFDLKDSVAAAIPSNMAPYQILLLIGQRRGGIWDSILLFLIWEGASGIVFRKKCGGMLFDSRRLPSMEILLSHDIISTGGALSLLPFTSILSSSLPHSLV